jgi:predicted nucleic acid-binding protein
MSCDFALVSVSWHDSIFRAQKIPQGAGQAQAQFLPGQYLASSAKSGGSYAAHDEEPVLDQVRPASIEQRADRHVLPTFSGRILAIDTEVAQRCATLHVPDPRSDRDTLIAATALVRGLTVATRNVADFEHMGVGVLNPWES